jgi:DNA-binding MarR family transcriptional regulator
MDIKTLREFRKNLRQLEQLLVAQLKEDTCCHGVSIAQCHCLLAVELLDLPSQNELADHLGLDKSTLSRTVEGLVKIGLLQRVANDGDRRIVRIGLTPQGKITCNTLNEANDVIYGRVLEGMRIPPEEVVTVFAELVRAMVLARKTSACQSISIKEGSENGM